MTSRYPEIKELLFAKERLLAPAAQKSFNSKGRLKKEQGNPFQTDFQIDKDRILHSKAFRRLKRKTQVFYTPINDHLRTRLTHTLEVSQIAYTLAKILNLNDDLTSAIALGHDLGHTPFGHSGEDALNSVSKNGFKHNIHSIRVVDVLENLNLTYETRDGILNHTGSLKEINAKTLEGQVVKFADKIAYLGHDIEDSIRANVLEMKQIPPDLRKFFDLENGGLTMRAIEEIYKNSAGQDVIKMGDDAHEMLCSLRSWMFENVYFAKKTKSDEENIKKIVTDLYYHYCVNHTEQEAIDYVAGMSDEFAIRKHAVLI